MINNPFHAQVAQLLNNHFSHPDSDFADREIVLNIAEDLVTMFTATHPRFDCETFNAIVSNKWDDSEGTY